MARREETGLDRDLADLPPDLRWREWLRRIEAVLFASSAPVARDHLLPLLGPVMTAHDLRLRGDALRLACHRSAARGVGQALPLAGTLARAAARLRAAVPKLRAKGAARAVEMMLSQDVLTPVALARAMPEILSDRAARRLCERLVELGALRELSGRDTFRLYGV